MIIMCIIVVIGVSYVIKVVVRERFNDAERKDYNAQQQWRIQAWIDRAWVKTGGGGRRRRIKCWGHALPGL